MNRSASTRGAVMITGASTGIGRASALALAEAGFQVFAGVRKRGDGETLRAASSGNLIPVIIDVTEADSIAAAAEQVRCAVGVTGLAGLVNNAGIGQAGPTEAFPVQDLRRLFEVNVFGQVAVMQAFLPLLRAGAGRMVNVGSIGDRLGLPFGAPLASSKCAIASITESLRLELRPWAIHVVLVEPGSIRTEAVAKAEAHANRVLDAMGSDLRGLYGSAYRSMIDRMLVMEGKGSGPEVVAAAIVRALTARRPHTRYLAGKDAHLLALLARWAPDRVFDRLRVRIFGLPTGFGTLATHSKHISADPTPGVVKDDI